MGGEIKITLQIMMMVNYISYSSIKHQHLSMKLWSLSSGTVMYKTYLSVSFYLKAVRPAFCKTSDLYVISESPYIVLRHIQHNACREEITPVSLKEQIGRA